MALDDTTWRWAPTIAPAGNNHIEVAPAGITEARLASYAQAPAEANQVAAAENTEIAPAPTSVPASNANRAGAQCESSAGGEQASPPAPAETDPTTALLPAEPSDDATALLIRARSFVERGWCRDALAKDATGIGIWPTDRRAIAWCAGGALVAAGWPLGDFRDPAHCRLKAAIGAEPIAYFNNRQETVEPVLAAFDRAISAGGQ